MFFKDEEENGGYCLQPCFPSEGEIHSTRVEAGMCLVKLFAKLLHLQYLYCRELTMCRRILMKLLLACPTLLLLNQGPFPGMKNNIVLFCPASKHVFHVQVYHRAPLPCSSSFDADGKVRT